MNTRGGPRLLARRALRQLHETGIRVGLCSNKPDEMWRILARHFRLARYIDEILGSDGVLESLADLVKPAPWT